MYGKLNRCREVIRCYGIKPFSQSKTEPSIVRTVTTPVTHRVERTVQF